MEQAIGFLRLLVIVTVLWSIVDAMESRCPKHQAPPCGLHGPMSRFVSYGQQSAQPDQDT